MLHAIQLNFFDPTVGLFRFQEPLDPKTPTVRQQQQQDELFCSISNGNLLPKPASGPSFINLQRSDFSPLLPLTVQVAVHQVFLKAQSWAQCFSESTTFKVCSFHFHYADDIQMFLSENLIYNKYFAFDHHVTSNGRVIRPETLYLHISLQQIAS